MSRTEVSAATRRELWRVAMGQCELCQAQLDSGTGGDLPTAVVAHNRALEDGGPRADPATSIPERNAIGNLLLTCPGCHDLIDKDADTYTVERLTRAKAEHEMRVAAVLEVSQPWNRSFGSVDYANLPRLAMLPGGGMVGRIAEAAGLNGREPFDGQGLAAGLFVQGLRSLLETWSQQAVPLDAAIVTRAAQGALVTFELACTYTRPAGGGQDTPAPPTLTAQLGDHCVSIRFDSQWLTTATARYNVDGAKYRPRIVAGMGRVVATSAREIQISAIVFGQPQAPQAALAEYAMSSRTAGRSVDIALFEQPTWVPGEASADAEDPGITLALHFCIDQSEQEPDPEWEGLLLNLFRQLQRVVPEYRRDLLVSAGVLAVETDDPGRSDAEERAVSLLETGEATPWRTFTMPSLASLLELYPVMIFVVGGLTASQGPDLHEALTRTSESYRGCVQVLDTYEVHRQAYCLPPAYRLAERDFHLLISPADAARGYTNGRVPRFIVDSGLFATVDVQVDEAAPDITPAPPDTATHPAGGGETCTAMSTRSSQPGIIALQRDAWFTQLCTDIVGSEGQPRRQTLDGVRDDLGDRLIVMALTFLEAVNQDGRGVRPADIARALAASDVFTAAPDVTALSQLVLAARAWALRFRHTSMAAAWDPEQLQFMIQQYWAAQRRTTCTAGQVRLELATNWAIEDPRTLDYLSDLPAGPLDDYQPFGKWLRDNLPDTRLASCLADAHTLPYASRAWDRWLARIPIGLHAPRHLWALGGDLARLPAVEVVFTQFLEGADGPAISEEHRDMFTRARTIVAERRMVLKQAVNGLTTVERDLVWLRGPDSRFQDDCIDNYLEYCGTFHARGTFDGVHPMRGAWGTHPWWSAGVASGDVPGALDLINDESPTIVMANEASRGRPHAVTLSVSGYADNGLGMRIEFSYDLRSPRDACELLLLARHGNLSIDILTQNQHYEAVLVSTTCICLHGPIVTNLKELATDALHKLWPTWCQDPVDGAHYALKELLQSESEELDRTSPRFLPS